MMGVSQSFIKIGGCSVLLFVVKMFPNYHECLLLSISIFATENFHLINQLGESGSSNRKIIFLLFANIFFSTIIGMTWAFLASYSLKQSYHQLATQFDNFDIIMMVLSPLVSYLMAETFNISGLLALMCCALLQSVYAKKNLEKERSHLLLNIFRALSYTTRSICEILMGIGVALHYKEFAKIGVVYIIISIIIIQGISFLGTWLVTNRCAKYDLLTEEEQKLLLVQNNSRGLLSYTLALQNFNSSMVLIALLNIVFNNLILDPILNYYTYKNHRELSTPKRIQDSPYQNEEEPHPPYGCFKSCLLNLHFFTLSHWLVKHSTENAAANSSVRFVNGFTGNAVGGDNYEDSYETHATQQMDISKQQYQLRMQSNRSSVQGTKRGEIELQEKGGKGKSGKRFSKGRNSGASQNQDEMKLKYSVFQ